MKNRIAWLLGTVNAVREAGAWRTRFSAIQETWRRGEFGFELHQKLVMLRALRYGVAVAGVLVAFALQSGLSAWVGGKLPMFILFYPMVVVVAMFGGWGPGLLATGLTLVVVDCWLYPPAGGLFTAAPVERLAMVLFACNGSLITLVAELFRRAFPKATAYDREQVLRQVRQEKQFLARLLEDAQQPFAVGYPDGRLGLMNRAYEQLTGYCAAELRTLDWSTVLTPPEWREPERRMLEELTHTGQPVRYEKEYLRKDGSRVPVELLVHLKSDASGQPEFYYSFITDITTRKQAEEALRLAAARTDAGSGTQLDVLDAETSLTEARTTQSLALRDYAVALAKLERAIGQEVAPAPPK